MNVSARAGNGSSAIYWENTAKVSPKYHFAIFNKLNFAALSAEETG